MEQYISHQGITYCLVACDDGFVHVKGNNNAFKFTILEDSWWFSMPVPMDLQLSLSAFVSTFPVF
jgi:hypothetical protein